MAEPLAPRPEPTPPVEPAETLVIEVPPPAPRKRRRWIGVVIALVVLGALLVVGFFVADAWARDYAKGYVRERIIEVLKLDRDADVSVDVGDDSILLQALSGRLNEVTVDVAELTFGDITGSAHIDATAVPFDGAQPVGTLDIVVAVSEENVQKLSGLLSGTALQSITLNEGFIRIGTEFNLIFFTVPVAVDLQPSAQDGGINFDPVTIVLGENEISVDELRDNPQLGGLASGLLASQQFCVAEYLPQALVVDGVEVLGSDLVISIDGDGTALGGPELATLGTCP
jgi:hypothetical protein